MPKMEDMEFREEDLQGDGPGKILRRPAMRSHNLEKKSSKRKRGFRKNREVASGDRRALKKMLGMG